MSEPSASQRWFSQDGALMPVRSQIRLLIRPQLPFSIQWIDRKVGSAGIAQGRMKTTSSALTHQRLRMKKPDSSSARNMLRFTPTIT